MSFVSATRPIPSTTGGTGLKYYISGGIDLCYPKKKQYCEDKNPDKVLQVIFKSLNAVEEIVNIILNGKLPDPADKAESGSNL